MSNSKPQIKPNNVRMKLNFFGHDYKVHFLMKMFLTNMSPSVLSFLKQLLSAETLTVTLVTTTLRNRPQGLHGGTEEL